MPAPTTTTSTSSIEAARYAAGDRAGTAAAFLTDGCSAGGASLRRRGPGLLGQHEGGIPGGPVLVALAGARLVLTVRSLGSLQRACECVHRGVRRARGVDAAGKSVGDLLQLPAVAVGVAELGERCIRAPFGVGPRRPLALAEAVGTAGAVVVHLGVDTARREVVVGRLDVGDHEEVGGRAGCRRREPGAEVDRAVGARRVELHD